MIDYLQYFFNLKHLFNLRPAAMQTRAVIILAIIFALFIVAAIISKFLTRTKDSLKAKGYKKFFHLFSTIAALGYVYLFFAWQGAILLSARFWLLILLIITIVWTVFILKYLLKDAPQKRKEINQKRQFEKYIP
ncbi:MAG: hypothetical protein A3J62_01100 [Candidatus Buchananbacteria bacterium RIFCSPHIGHO2_02_FULL_38_8]|uniref:Uncharacterized protein n=2 Tax=Candidatus Buchananiibacteriota TaxID=1817903 RepID=A0A1G1XWX8_9BACT|nr:MAG: hypothetical protein A2731_02295 [Candidatus Buchananbacteria bacterium RIFCSPHIGHO2_01_FULL_39_8]OGY47789.1 MAG: hypothetical protein A3J62_01100 [Candidatus Buchananbacteria bacterium RIFCSPHIGHO2_02_FULL_38_8]